MTPAAPAPARSPSWQEVIAEAFATLATEVAEPVALSVLEGEVPDDLRGVLLRNGPGRQERGGVRYGHPFDGDGFVQRVAFADGEVSYRARFVRTEAFVAEEAADRILYRGFGTQKPGGLLPNLLRMRFKNAANTSVVHHGGHTLALWEGGLPHAFDPVTLETIGPHDYDGVLRNEGVQAWLAPHRPFSAHPTICPRTGAMFNFGTAYGPTPQLLIHEVDETGRCRTRAHALDALPFVHDMVLTERFVVLMLPAVSFDVAAALLGLKSPVASLDLRDAPGELWLVPRGGGDPVRLPVSPGFVFHWACAWETRSRDPRGPDQVVMDGVKYDTFPQLDDVDTVLEGGDPLVAHLVRWTVDLRRGEVTERRLHDLPMELPTCMGEGPERVLFGTGAPAGRVQPFLSALVRHGPEGVTHRELAPDLPGEPLVCGRWLVTQVWRAQTASSELWVVDPDTLRTVARLALPAPVPPALHGTWLPAARG